MITDDCLLIIEHYRSAIPVEAFEDELRRILGKPVLGKVS
jgi:hypothetical protein